MGFKRPLVQLQSLGPSKTVVTVWRLFFRLGDRDQRPLANSNPPLGVPNAKRRHAAGSTPVTRTNMNSRHSVAAVFSFRRKGTGGKFKFATDLPDIVLICALQQNRQKKHTNLQTFTICRVNKMWYNTSRRGQLQGRFPLCRYCVPRRGLQFGRICPTKYNCTARRISVRCSFLMYSMA